MRKDVQLKDVQNIRQNLNVVLEENEIVESHTHTDEQLNGRNSFQYTMEIGNKEDIENSKAMFEKDEEKTIGDFLSLIEYF